MPFSPPEDGHRPYTLHDGVAVLEIKGPVMKTQGILAWLFGGTPTAEIVHAVNALMRDESAKKVLVKIDSPGGTAAGSFDVAERLSKLSQMKETITYADDEMCSAAYLIGCSTNAVYANRMANVGSIGTAVIMADTSKLAEKHGVKIIKIKTGKYKMMGFPGSKITQGEIDRITEQVEEVNDMFVSHVSEHRGIDKETILGFEAATFLAEKGLQNGLLDGIMPYEELLDRFSKGSSLPIGTGGTERKKLAAADRSPAMFTQPQMARIRAIQGLESADPGNFPDTADKVIARATQLSTERESLSGQVTSLTNQITQLKATAQVVDPNIAAQTIALGAKRIDFMAKSGTITPAQAEVLKNEINPAGKPNVTMVAPDGRIFVSLDTVEKCLGEKPNGDVTKVQTGAQPAPKGDGAASESAATMTLPEYNMQRATYGLAPVDVLPPGIVSSQKKPAA
jgi:signal peptide peptidase SppA